MKYRTTNIGKIKRIKGGQIRAINTTGDSCAATLTTRYDAVGPTNIISLAHYPMTVALIEYEL